MIPRVVISAPKGMSGKTIISLGITDWLKGGLK
ncbi:cobyrinic acid a,c-diamide synthase (cbiA) part 1, authentic frameshift [Pyrobaculum aerophilum str. IM2]|uniref:Cobyrinic acid a,c-diamide synthase (CbiA) part 1, authentic frameshift n=1 Tax=Pyrobaculum aerophilum (strain ATCC 51768 / DSM 7523 / JCM 9630 / CIP 104966 / NBRC 100827 / IM2) TaxID=178306 RepID=Q8ZUV6_PYRAE|nr:cobyrinic acid a,c-diamide synthase (cbiA) part 1, authentic frameshift [Pyrobaculum aerophilum str. IM2]